MSDFFRSLNQEKGYKKLLIPFYTPKNVNRKSCVVQENNTFLASSIMNVQFEDQPVGTGNNMFKRSPFQNNKIPRVL